MPKPWVYAWAWLLNLETPLPPVPGLEPLHGIAGPRPQRPKRAPNPNADRITQQVNEIDVETWLDGHPDIELVGLDGSCGCPVFHYRFARTLRSGIWHVGCEYGFGVHFFSGTLIDAYGGKDHDSPLNFSAWLHGVTRAEAARRVGIRFSEELAGWTPEEFDQAAAAAGDETQSARLREAAATLRLLPGGGGGGPTTPRAPLSAVPRIGSVLGNTVIEEEDGDVEALAVPDPAMPRPPSPAAPRIGTVLGNTVLDEEATTEEQQAPKAVADEELSDLEPDALSVTITEAVIARNLEAADLYLELRAWFATRPDEGTELTALMQLSTIERAEVVAAVLDGRMTRLDLGTVDLVSTAHAHRHAWTRLREGSARPWSLDDLKPLSDAELDAALNAEPPTADLGGGLFYDRGIHVLAGPPGCGKTFVALNLCRSVVPPVPTGGPRVEAVYLDLDQNLTLPQRLSNLGLGRGALRARQVVLINVSGLAAERKQGPLATLWSVVDALATAESAPRVVVIDSLARVMAETLESSNDGDAVTRVMNLLSRLAERCCVVVLDHTGHAADDRPSGSVAKIGATRAVLTLKPTGTNAEEFPDTVAGSWVTITKDRDGGIRRSAARDDRDAKPCAGLVTLEGAAEGAISAVRFIAKRTMEAAQGRRESAAGRTFAAEARRLILELVDIAARAAVCKSMTTASRPDIVPPLSFTGACNAAWEQLQGRGDGKRNDVRAAGKQLLKTGALMDYHANWGKGVSGARLRVRGGISGSGQLDPVDLDALAATISAVVDHGADTDTDDTAGTAE
jgi:hypothetical protein